MAIHLEDWRLAKRLLAGDERAFAQFFDEYFSRLYRFALTRLSGDEDVAREVVQGALSRALQKIAGFRGESTLFTWLCVICRNEIADWARRNAGYHRHVVLTEDRPEIQAAVESFNAPEHDSPPVRFQRTEAARRGVRLLGVGVAGLEPGGIEQLELFAGEAESRRGAESAAAARRA